MTEELYLNDIWNIYFHDPFDKDWNVKSYILLSQISSIEDFWMNIDCMTNISEKQQNNTLDNPLNYGMFFITREHIFPSWDDPENINGGRLSLKILKEKTTNFWIDLCCKLLGENILKKNYKEHWNYVNGISISPKKQFCIIKIWVKDQLLTDKKCFDLLNDYYGDIIYESNIESLHNNYNLQNS